MNARTTVVLGNLVACLWLLANAEAVVAQPKAARDKPEAGNDVDVARGHFRLGIDSYRDGDLPTALIEFKRAYAAAPNYRLLYNLAQVSQELRDYPAAERYYVQYLAEGGPQLEAVRRQEVELELQKARARIASINLTTNIAGAEVLVDDVPSGRTPLRAPVRVSTGRRRVSARAEGYSPITQVIDAAGGEAVEVHFDLKPLAEALTVPAPVAATAPSTHFKPLPLVLLLGTGALAVGAGVTAVLAESKAEDYRDALTRKTTTKELRSLADAAKDRALVCDVLLGATAVAATASVLLIWKGGMRERDKVELRATAGGLQLNGRF